MIKIGFINTKINPIKWDRTIARITCENNIQSFMSTIVLEYQSRYGARLDTQKKAAWT